LILAFVAAFFGFGIVVGMAALIAKVVVVLFLVRFLVSLLTARRAPVG
jgi:uncharacterized membrane protein YtjA (UPF0391 family)